MEAITSRVEAIATSNKNLCMRLQVIAFWNVLPDSVAPSVGTIIACDSSSMRRGNDWCRIDCLLWSTKWRDAQVCTKRLGGGTDLEPP